jgi:glycosyltransferase involved in cell wall biosynthesis
MNQQHPSPASPDAPPLVSVVTIVRNGRAHVERAIKSVLAQTYPAVEYVIKDGGSTDGTLEILERYRGRVARIESRRDGGISDAWNQALGFCTGRYVALLNADDEFTPGLLACAVATLEETGAALAYGDVELFHEDGRAPRRVHGTWNPARLWQGTGFLHPGMVARRDAYLRFGGFREDLRYAMDADWILRLHRAGAVFRKHQGLCRMSLGGQSNTNWRMTRREYLQAMRDNGLPPWQRALAQGWILALRAKKRLSGRR